MDSPRKFDPFLRMEFELLNEQEVKHVTRLLERNITKKTKRYRSNKKGAPQYRTIDHGINSGSRANQVYQSNRLPLRDYLEKEL